VRREPFRSVHLAPCDSLFSLDDLAGRIRESSNFRFVWQFYEHRGVDPRSPADVRRALDTIATAPELHRFLRASFDPLYHPVFEIDTPHVHCPTAPAAGDLESLLAQAAGDHLGAYSRILRDATVDEKREVRELFLSTGDYQAYQLVPGSVAGCPTCRLYNHHLFTNWFYGVAWDYCLFAVWPGLDRFWMGCLTDTD
jgi:hypothetical protein